VIRSILAIGVSLLAAKIPTDQIWSVVNGYGVPPYFSGTNSRIAVTVGMTYDGLDRVEMHIGGELVWEEDYPLGFPPILALSDYHQTIFDSTHFPHGESVEVTVKVWGQEPSYREFSEEVPVINHAVLYGRNDLENYFLGWVDGPGWVQAGESKAPYRSLPSSYSRLPGMGYYIEAYMKTMGWTAQQFGEATEDCNVLHVHSHGALDFFWSDSNDYWYAYPEFPAQGHPPTNVYALSLPESPPTGSIALLAHRIAANGSATPLPPFNTSGKPPINLVYLDTCYSGLTNDFAEATLYPYGNIYAGVSQYPEDQSCVGHAIAVQLDQSRAVNEAFWGHLEDTYTVSEARLVVFNAYSGTNKPTYATDFMHVWEDFYTRLKGVYTGTTGAESRWYL